jgi:hypothetical protein
MDLTRTDWRRSSYSGANGGNCVEVASNLPGIITVRDSKDPLGPALTFRTGAWQILLHDIKSGDLNLT